MQAIILNKPEDFTIKEIPTPQIADDEVLIRIMTSGICANDVRDFHGECNYSYPRIGGHEYCGIIEAMGAKVDQKKFHIGQKVVKYIIENCGICSYCRRGDENICFGHQESPVFHNPYGLSGYLGFAQYKNAKARDIMTYSDDTPFEKMALTEPLACVINSINRTNISLGDDVVVIGGGTMGLLHVLVAKLKGARVILSEPMEERRKKALALGCDEVIDPMAGDPVEKVRSLTSGEGGLSVFNTLANPKFAPQAIEMTAPTGTCVMFSSMHPNSPVPVDMGRVHSCQITITGAVSPTIKAFYQSVELIDKGLVDPTPLIEKVYDYRDFGEAIEVAGRPDTYKVILNFA